MKISLRKGQTIWLTLKAPKSGEVFQVPLELADENILMPKVGGLAVNDTTAYTNWQEDQMKEMARREILAAAQKLKDPAFYGPTDGYTNLVAQEYGVGGSNPRLSKKQKEEGMI